MNGKNKKVIAVSFVAIMVMMAFLGVVSAVTIEHHTMWKGTEDSIVTVHGSTGHALSTVNETTEFYVTDSRAVCLVQIERINRGDTFRFEWYDPSDLLYQVDNSSTDPYFNCWFRIYSDGKTSYETQGYKILQAGTVDVSPPQLGWGTCWLSRSLKIDGNPPANKIGNWHVDFYYNDEKQFTETFTISDSIPESGAPTSGRWIGTTSEGEAVAFNVSDTQVYNFSISYSYSCSSGGHGHMTTELRYPPIDIIENKFQYDSHDQSIYGEFTSPNFATGTYRETWRDWTSPWMVTCDSGNITWNATKAEIYTGDTEPIVTASLGESVDNINLSWSTGGNAKWSWQNSTYYYGGDAAQSGTISHNQESWIQTTVSGPGTLSYYWNVSSEAKNDSLKFYIDNIWNDEISGSIGWQKKGYNLTPGIHTLKWSYMKDDRVNRGSDCGWLDKVEFAAVPTPPPASVTNLNESSVGITWINWTWINPEDENFNHTMVYINGAVKAKVDKDTNYYKAIGLSPASIHTISTHTVDIWGNINQTWVNDTAMTREAPDIWVSPTEIKVALLQEEVEKRNLTLGNNGPGVLEFEVNATVKDWLSVYPSSGIIESGEQTNITVNLSANMFINGTYLGYIIVASNDPDESQLDIPVTLYVGRVVNESIYIDFDVTDAILSKDGKYIYLSSKPDYKLYIVNLTIGSLDKISFSNMTESLTITPQGDAIYLALLTREHDAYWWDEDGHEGFIAEIDPDTRSLVKRFWINEDPYDIVATSDGYLYVSSGSGQWTYIRGYDLSTTSEVGSAGIRQRSHIKLHPGENYIYAADTDSSPSDIEKFRISDGSIQTLYDSPYHGDYPMCGDLEISPDGTKIFTKCGHIFRSTESQSTDMTHIGTLGNAWNSLTFDEMNNIYTVSGTSVRKYNYDTNEAMGGKSINGNGKFIFYKNGYLIVVTEDGDFPTKSSIQIIDATPTPPPASVTNLNESAVGTTWINWTWINPVDENFNHTMVYINGAFKAKVDKNTNYYKAIGLSPASIHTISTHTVDIWGNINQTWVNDTAMTREAPDIWVSPTEIKVALLQEEVEKRNLTLGNNGPGVLEFEVTDTVDWLSVYPSSGIVDSGEQTNVTVDVSANMLINGAYFGDIIVASNDPDESLLDIPVTLYVGKVINESIYIDFDVTDALLSKDGKYIYLSSKPDYKLYIVNLTIGSLDKISFSNMTESLTITPQGDAIYLALLTREHDAYWWDEDGHEGFIAEIDPDTRSLVKRFWINEDPYDIVATSDGYLYVSSGSGQYTYIRGYNLSTASEVGSAPIRHRSHIKLHPSENYIYSADTDISPSDIEKFSISHGGIQALYDSPYMHSPYHGDYPMCGDLEISPDGTKIFTKCGHIFRSTKSQSTDMTHIGTLGDAWNSLTFDEMNNIYTVCGTSVRKYNYDTYEVMGEKSINGNGRFVFYKNGYLIVITEDGDFPTKSSIQIIDASPAPPASVNSLNESAVGITWINWTGINPEDEESNHTTVYIDGEFKANVNRPTNYYRAIGLSPGANHTISTHTVDSWGIKTV